MLVHVLLYEVGNESEGIHSIDIKGKTITEMPASLTEYRKAKPIYKTLPGWNSLPEKVKLLFLYFIF